MLGAGRGQSPPTFPGLMPTSGRVTIPRGFTPPRESSPISDSTEDMDLDTSTTEAMREWDEIRKAFEVFRARLGPDFEPMGPDVAPPVMTPFGPALMYRTYSIAGIWLNYYMGLIVLHRSHPSMPPVAVIAAGMAAPQTGRWANEIARICAGLHEDTTHVSAISTLVGAAFIESCFPLFVAGIQVCLTLNSPLPSLFLQNTRLTPFLPTVPRYPSTTLGHPPPPRHYPAYRLAVRAPNCRGV